MHLLKQLKSNGILNFRASLKSADGDPDHVIYRSSAPDFNPDPAAAMKVLDDHRIGTLIDLRTTSEKSGSSRVQFFKDFNEYEVDEHVDMLKPLKEVVADRRDVIEINCISFWTVVYLGLVQILWRPWRYLMSLLRGIWRNNFVEVRSKIVVDFMNEAGLRGFCTKLLYFDGGRAMRQIVHLLATKGIKYPVLLHCAHGKDRTGVFLALLQELCGYPEEQIVRDYVITQEIFPEEVRIALARRSGYIDELAGAPPEMIRKLLRDIRYRHGSAEKYFLSIGARKSDLDIIRSMFQPK